MSPLLYWVLLVLPQPRVDARAERKEATVGFGGSTEGKVVKSYW